MPRPYHAAPRGKPRCDLFAGLSRMDSPNALLAGATSCLAAFSFATYSWLLAIGYFDPAVVALADPAIDRRDAVLAIALAIGSHLVRRPSRVRRLFRVEAYDGSPYRVAPAAQRVLTNGPYVARAIASARQRGLAWALAMSLSIALIGFANLPTSTHVIARAHPLDWLVFFFASLGAVVMHACLPRGTEGH